MSSNDCLTWMVMVLCKCITYWMTANLWPTGYGRKSWVWFLGIGYKDTEAFSLFFLLLIIEWDLLDYSGENQQQGIQTYNKAYQQQKYHRVPWRAPWMRNSCFPKSQYQLAGHRCAPSWWSGLQATVKFDCSLRKDPEVSNAVIPETETV